MANQEHVEMLLRDGVEAWNQWRNEHPDIQPDLRKANLAGAELSAADLRKANLVRANLVGANLRKADLSEADLSEADLHSTTVEGAHLVAARLLAVDLSEARLREADLSEADLSEADLREADLSYADLRRAHLNDADLRGTRFVGATLRGVDLSEARCISTDFTGAMLTDCDVYGISAWNLRLGGAVQADLHITSWLEKADITVDNLEVAQFLHLLLHNEKMRAILDTITSKVVLILGRFSSERKPILDALREALRSHPSGYIPVLFDFEPQTDKPVLETVKTLANLSRFVIADLTDPNMVRSELSYITANLPTVPVQPLIESNANLPTEYSTWRRYATFLPVYEYADLSHLLANLTESVLTPVEAHVQARHL